MRSILFLLFALAMPAAAAAPPVQLGLCSACHADDGRAGPAGTPRLAGQDRDYLVAALTAYREGDRTHAAMAAIAGTLSESDIDALADWYATREPHAP
jgi:cytochrome c553